MTSQLAIKQNSQRFNLLDRQKKPKLTEAIEKFGGTFHTWIDIQDGTANFVNISHISIEVTGLTGDDFVNDGFACDMLVNTGLIDKEKANRLLEIARKNNSIIHVYRKSFGGVGTDPSLP